MLDESAPLHHALTVLRRDLQGRCHRALALCLWLEIIHVETMGGELPKTTG